MMKERNQKWQYHMAEGWVAAILICVFSTVAHAGILRVSLDGDGSNGESWPTAFTSVTDAIAASASGDEIWVASGTYNETLVLIPGISLYGGFSGTEGDDGFDLRDWEANETIIDASGYSVTAVQGASHTVVDGFTVTRARMREPFGLGGGGFQCYGIEMIIRNCDICNNVVLCYDPWLWCGSGGGIYVLDSQVLIENCRIHHNATAIRDGDGIGVYELSGDSVVTILNCLIYENPYDGLAIGGGRVTVINCTFGLGVEFFDISGSDRLFPARIVNSIVRSLSKSIYSISNSNVPNHPGNGNIDEDPQWVDPENGDYRLKLSSPCIDSGTTTGPATDLDGNPRPVDVLGIGRDGPGAYDMGCYEFQLPQADLNSDGQVNAHDLFLFEDQWHGQ